MFYLKSFCFDAICKTFLFTELKTLITLIIFPYFKKKNSSLVKKLDFSFHVITRGAPLSLIRILYLSLTFQNFKVQIIVISLFLYFE